MKPYLFFLLSFFLLLLPVTASADCGSLSMQSEQAVQNRDVDNLSALYNQAKNDDTCSDDFRSWLGRQTAIVYVGMARQRVRQSLDVEAIDLLNQSLQYDRYWMALAMLADVYAQQKQHARASSLYQESLDVIDDPAATPTPPAVAVIESIFKKAEQTRLLAKHFVPSPRNRAGKPGGLSAVSVRGFTPKKVAVPVTFPFDSDQFDAKGSRAAQNLLADLKEQGEPDITLIGHTDSAGDNDYNLNLSIKRATRLKQYLQDNTYHGQIRVRGMGEDEPYDPGSGTAFTTEERNRMCRRVEMKRN